MSTAVVWFRRDLRMNDNPALAEYIMKDIMTRLIKDFNDPPYTVERGSIVNTGDAMTKTETKSTVLLKHHLKTLKLPTMQSECEKLAA